MISKDVLAERPRRRWPECSRRRACSGGGEQGADAGDTRRPRRARGKRVHDRDDREELDQPGLPVGAHRRRGGGEGAVAEARRARSKIAWLTPPQEDGQVQAQRIAQAVNEGANAILISCSDAGKVTGAINDAVAAACR